MANFRFPHSALGRAAFSLTIVLLADWAYALAAVPLIEPRITRTRSANRTRPVAPLTEVRHRDLELLFSPDDWERQDPIVLENVDRGKLLIGGYQPLADGTVEISPCTIVMYPEGEFASDEERVRHAIVLQAPEKAILRFDEPFDIRKGKIGKLVAGSLVGPIVIRSDQKEPGPADDLRIETRDVQLTDSRIFSPHPVKFRWGKNYGSGTQMQIELLPKDDGPRSRGPSVGGLKSFELARDVRLHLVPTGKELRASGGNLASGGAPNEIAAASQSAVTTGPVPLLPIEITCRGPFRFDLAMSMATFRDHVDVNQLQPNGMSDQIFGELLAIYFGPRQAEGAAADIVPTSTSEGNTKLEAKRLEVKGNPVVIHSQSNSVQARGERLEYDIPTRRISLSSQSEVVVTRGSDEIRASQLHYQPGEQGRIGRFIAVGAGWLRAIIDERTNQQFEARWGKQLWLRPDPAAPHNDVVSLEGSAEARMPGMGGLKADDIYCWLLERPATGRRPGQAATSTPASIPEGKTELAPDRMLARGSVELDSAQLTGLTDQLEVWFDSVLLPQQPAQPIATIAAYSPATTAEPAPAPRGQLAAAIAPPPAPARAAPPAGIAGLARTGRDEPEQQFDVTGKLLRVRLALLGWDPELSELIVEGQARFEETKAVRQGAKPTLVTGDRIHVVQTTPVQATVTVTGQPQQPARVEAGGMTLVGGAINLDRAANRMWIDGPGTMTMILDRDMQGRPLAKPQPLDVSWRQAMNFDGRLATFEQSVVAQGQHQELKTQVLKILLSERIDFVEKREAAARPDVAELVCQGGVFIDGRTYDEQGLASIDHMEAADLTVNMASGDILAHAPTYGKGRMTQVRRGSGPSAVAVPGLPQEPATAADDEDQLSYLRVEFNRTLSGNMNQREVVFGDDVHTVYGPVPNWEAKLDPNVKDGLGPRGIEMTCEQLKVREMTGSTAEARFIELEAAGNTDVTGTGFRASASILRYSSVKQKLELDGGGRRNATIWRQLRPGANPETISAKLIEYWPQTRRLRIDKVNSSSMSQPISP
jgi:hypothetical protein